LIEEKFKKNGLSLRFKILLIIIPILVISLIVSNQIAYWFFYKAIENNGNEFTLYKSDQLEKYIIGQWQILDENQFLEEEIYIQASIQSISLYMMDLIHSDDEIILFFDNKYNLLFSSSDLDLQPEESTALNRATDAGKSQWIDLSLQGEQWIGRTFSFPSMEWQFFILERKSAFYTEIGKLATIENWLIFIIICMASIIVSLFLRTLLNPLERITKGIQSIARTRNFEEKVSVEYSDEIGLLAYEFNNMTSSLNHMYKRLQLVIQAEEDSKHEVILREFEALNTLSLAAEYRDPETRAHTVRVAEMAALFSRLLGHDEETQSLYLQVSALHDLGKLAIPDNILLKPGALSVEEFDVIKTHTVSGYNILKDCSSKFLVKGAEIALYHHEKYDGSGYPEGLIGEEIPISGRIICVIDVFDALTSKRSYKEAWPIHKAVSLLIQEKGKHFDPQLIDLFLSHQDSFVEILKTHQD
jgi:response regulator RpfG family c-di-GMP phosphodiesterase